LYSDSLDSEFASYLLSPYTLTIFIKAHDYYQPIIFLGIPLLGVQATNSIYTPAMVHGSTTINDPTNGIVSRKDADITENNDGT
jgi:hypothetical protein